MIPDTVKTMGDLVDFIKACFSDEVATRMIAILEAEYDRLEAT